MSSEIEVIEEWEVAKERAIRMGFTIGSSFGMVLTRGADEWGFSELSALRGFLLGWQSHDNASK